MLKHFKSSPLWLIGLFVLFAEATSAVAAVKLDGWPQQALVIFVIAYSTVVTAIFFLFLWFKPENFYAPSEYGEISPESYVRALRGLPDDAVNAVVTLEDNPFDKEALFSLMEHLISEDVKQHLILISRIGGELDISRPNPNDRTHSYEIVTRQKGISFGTFSPREFLAKLEGTQLVMTTEGESKLRLTNRGSQFVKWLVEHEKDAKMFWSDMGGWGERKSLPDLMKELTSNNS